jgi:error-prone DNA polymerase
MGFKRSQARMREIEAKLRAGMTQNGISSKAQEEIILSITSFALYGFPESHAASFALIAYASAYLKCHYLAAFTAALLNNQPMGFYSPATIVKDAQRHGLKMLPVDVTQAEWMCTLEAVSSQHSAVSQIALRLGLRYVRGLREEAGQALVRERACATFTSIHDLTRRVPELRKDELNTLAEIGALNKIGNPPRRHPSAALRAGSDTEKSEIKNFSVPPCLRGENSLHRRDALWQVERAVRRSGPLLENQPETDSPSPLQPMNHEERLVADFHGTGMTVGPHPMSYRREWLKAMGIRRAIELRDLPNGKRLRIGGCVITRQRPGTAKGFVFLSLEDETGVANAIVAPDLFHRNRLLLTSERFLAIEGILQNQDNVISVKAERVQPLFVTKAETLSHDFH